MSSVSPGCQSSSLWIQGCEVFVSGRALTPLFPSLHKVSPSAETLLCYGACLWDSETWPWLYFSHPHSSQAPGHSLMVVSNTLHPPHQPCGVINTLHLPHQQWSEQHPSPTPSAMRRSTLSTYPMSCKWAASLKWTAQRINKVVISTWKLALPHEACVSVSCFLLGTNNGSHGPWVSVKSMWEFHFIKIVLCVELERWLRGEEHWMFFQRTLVQFPEPAW